MTLRRPIRSRWVAILFFALGFSGALFLTVALRILIALWPALTEGWNSSSVTQSELLIEQTVIPAIEAFKTREGRYPRRIDDLVPSYLNQLPALPTGQLSLWSNTYLLVTKPDSKAPGYYELHLRSRGHERFLGNLFEHRHRQFVSDEKKWYTPQDW